MTPIIPMPPPSRRRAQALPVSPGRAEPLPHAPPEPSPQPLPEPCWREMMAGVFDGTLSPEARLEALMDHIERGRP